MKQFKAESKRLMDLMINSIYTHKDIFLRELISNANDAIDKLYLKSLDEKLGLAREDFKIEIIFDKDNRTLSIRDNGIGMTAEELENNLGIIAKSGTLAFKKDNPKQDDVNMIGQFGVGFYSSFMVSDEVRVTSKPYGSEECNCWISKGAEGYVIEKAEKADYGTIVEMKIKTDDDDFKYDEYLEMYHIRSIVKKYSDYIAYPIVTLVEKTRNIGGDDEAAESEENSDKTLEKKTEKYMELETLNSMTPIWKKKKSDVTEQELNAFYKDKFMDYRDPIKVIQSKVEGNVTYSTLMFVPSEPPYNFYTKEYEKGLQLYSNGVLIMDKCVDLLPDYFGFVKGLVDSADLSLNISREMLQKDKQLQSISKSIEKKIKAELVKFMKDDRENYDKFFAKMGLTIKFGVYSDYGMHKDELKDLIMFYSSKEKKLVSLAEYCERMTADQKFIYYASGESNDKIDKLPQVELVKDKGFEILYLTEQVDEFAIKILDKFNEKQFKSVASKDLGLETEEEKSEAKKKTEDNQEMFEFMTKALLGKVKSVVLSTRLKSHAVCVRADGEVSLEMEKVLNSNPDAANKIKVDRVLEVNDKHPIFEVLKKAFAQDKDKLTKYSEILFNQALLMEGIAVEDPIKLTDLICEMMA